MSKIKVEVKGLSPLILNRFFVEKDKKSMRKKVYVPEDEAEKKTYRTEKGELYIPCTHFKASMVKASTDFKMVGKKTYKEYIKAGIIITPIEIILDQQEYEIHEEPVVIARVRVMSWRPKIKEWTCKFIIEIIDEEMINQSTLKEILESAGKYKGVGDHRPEFGRFEVVEFKIIK